MVHAFDRCLMPPPAAAPRRPPAASSQPWLLQVFRATLSVLRIKNSMGAVQVRRALPAATCKCRRANTDCPSPNAPLTRSPPPQPGKVLHTACC